MAFNILIVPGYHGSGDGHWQTWLQQQLPNAKRVSGIDWERPILHNWSKAIIENLDQTTDQSVIVAHSFGCLASAMTVANRPQKVAGVLFVAPADPQRFSLFGSRSVGVGTSGSQPVGVKNVASGQNNFAAQPDIARYLPSGPLNTPGVLIGSRDDPWMKLQHAYAWSKRWQLAFRDAGAVGHINIDSGFGPWPWIKTALLSFCDELIDAKNDLQSQRLLAANSLHQSVVFNQQHLLYC